MVQMWEKAAVKNDTKNAHEIIFYLKNQYLPPIKERGTFIEDILSQADRFSFEGISDYLKNFSKSIKEVESMSLKNKALLHGSISTAENVFRLNINVREDLPGWFEDWMYSECWIKKKTIYN